MSLSRRLLLWIAVLTLVATAAYGLAVRGAWRAAEEERFDRSFTDARTQLERELTRQLTELPVRVGLLCDQSPIVDRALIGLVAGRGQIEPSSLLAIRLLTPNLRLAVGFDELVLFGDSGMVYAASPDRALEGRTEPRWREAKSRTSSAALALDDPARATAVCTRERGTSRVGLRAAVHLAPLFERLSATYQLELSFAEPTSEGDVLARQVSLPGTESVLFASRSRESLSRTLRDLDFAVLALGLVTVGVALVLAAVMARGLARPIVELAAQARSIAHAEPTPVHARGGQELEALAHAFNRAISDLAQLRKRLAVTERIAARKEVAREVAHEIKNPLAPIRAAIETLRRLRARQDPAFHDYFDEASRTVLDEVNRITTIVGEFSRFARMPALEIADVELSELAHDVVSLHSGADARVLLHDGGVPTIRGDRDQLVQVLTNLVQNAIQATRDVPNGEVHVSLSCPDDGVVELSVTDNGPGVAPAMRERLFEVYATDKPGGTGLGLVIVQRIVVEHGGDIRYQPVSPSGARFTIHLPTAGPIPAPQSAPEPRT